MLRGTHEETVRLHPENTPKLALSGTTGQLISTSMREARMTRLMAVFGQNKE